VDIEWNLEALVGGYCTTRGERKGGSGKTMSRGEKILFNLDADERGE